MSEFNEQAFHAVVLGNIASGKTDNVNTVAKMLKEDRVDCHVALEPVEEWETSGLLDQLYEQTEKTAFAFQMVALIDRMGEYTDIPDKSNPEKIIISDGHIISDRFLFTENFIKLKKFTQPEITNYRRLFKKWLGMIAKPKVDVIFILNANPTTCFERRIKRGRVSERAIPLEYFQSLDSMLSKLGSNILNPNNNTDDMKDMDLPLFPDAELIYINAERPLTEVSKDIYEQILNKRLEKARRLERATGNASPQPINV